MSDRVTDDGLAMELGFKFDEVDTARDLLRLLNYFNADQRRITPLDSHLQDQLVTKIEQIAGWLRNRHAVWWRAREHSVLNSAASGIVLANSTVTVQTVRELSRNTEATTPQGYSPPVFGFHRYGLTVQPLVATILSDRLMQLPMDDWDAHIAYHLLFMLSDNNLPQLMQFGLMEQLAAEAIGLKQYPDSGKSPAMWFMHHCLKLIREHITDDVVWLALRDVALVEEVRYNSSGPWIPTRLVGHPFHDSMREQMKDPADWDRFIDRVIRRHMFGAWTLLRFGLKGR